VRRKFGFGDHPASEPKAVLLDQKAAASGDPPPAINRHRRRAAPWPSTSTSGSGSGSDANGDAVPRQLSGLLKHHLRPDDVLGRFGG